MWKDSLLVSKWTWILFNVCCLFFARQIWAQGPVISDQPWKCEDEELDCPERVKNGSCLGLISVTDSRLLGKQLAQKTLLECRASCLKYFEENQEDMPDLMVRFYHMNGSANDTVIDPFGYEYQICDRSNGFYGQARNNIIEKWYIYYAAHLGMGPIAPKYTKLGFKKTRVTKGLWGDILDYYNSRRNQKWIPEICDRGLHNCMEAIDDEDECRERDSGKMEFLPLPLIVRDMIHKQLIKHAEKWAGIKLEPVVVYGIRRYLRGSWMTSHIDAADTHIISAIINVNQKVDTPWPLDVLDHDGQHHKVVMKPGDLVWYESARVLHGRVTPLNGQFYDNIFVHFVPLSWTKQVEQLRETKREELLMYAQSSQQHLPHT